MEYASWGKRAGALLIDNAIVIVPMLIIAGIGGAIASAANSGAIAALFSLVAYGGGFALAIYNRAYLAGTTGQSWGRKVLGIRLISEATGQPMGAGMAFVRDLAHALDTLACYVGWLFPLWDAKKQTFADKVLTTVVVEA